MTFHLHPFAISNLLIIAFLPPAAFILIKAKNKYALTYALHLLAVSIWGLCALIGTTSNNIHISDITLKIGYAIGMFNSPFFLHSAYIIIKKKFDWIIAFSYIISAFLAIWTFNGSLFVQPKIYFDSFYYFDLKSKPLFVFGFITWLLILLYAHILFSISIKNAPKILNMSIKSYLYASIGHLGAITLFLPELFNIYPWGSFLIGPIGLIITYLIFKHQAFEIKIALEKSIVYSTLIVAISILYLIIVLGLERLFAQFFHYQSMTISIAAAFGIGLLVFPLRSKIQKIMDRYFFSGTQSEVYEKNLQLQAEVEQSQRLKTATTLASGLAHEK